MFPYLIVAFLFSSPFAWKSLHSLTSACLLTLSVVTSSFLTRSSKYGHVFPLGPQTLWALSFYTPRTFYQKIFSQNLPHLDHQLLVMGLCLPLFEERLVVGDLISFIPVPGTGHRTHFKWIKTGTMRTAAPSSSICLCSPLKHLHGRHSRSSLSQQKHGNRPVRGQTGQIVGHLSGSGAFPGSEHSAEAAKLLLS